MWRHSFKFATHVRTAETVEACINTSHMCLLYLRFTNLIRELDNILNHAYMLKANGPLSGASCVAHVKDT